LHNKITDSSKYNKEKIKQDNEIESDRDKGLDFNNLEKLSGTKIFSNV
jgi:hypothetical protein